MKNMFCQNCGKPIEDNAKFCTSCGAATNIENTNPARHAGSTANVDDNEIVLRIKPKFLSLPIILTSFLIAIFCAGTFGVQLYVVSSYNLLLVIILVVLLLIFIPPLYYFYALGKNNNTVYSFYKTKVEYHEGFLGRDTKTLKYSRILETELRRGLIQQYYKVGTIYLSTGGMAISGNTTGNGVLIKNIPSPDENYLSIKKLIDSGH